MYGEIRRSGSLKNLFGSRVLRALKVFIDENANAKVHNLFASGRCRIRGFAVKSNMELTVSGVDRRSQALY